jgi:hypothetical protein
MLITEEFETPKGMFVLPTPVFRQHHAENWWREVLDVRKWPPHRLPQILHGFARPLDPECDDQLDMECVYDDLLDAINLLKDHTDEDRFYDAWTRLKQGAA